MTAATILPREDVARITARALLEVQAVHLRPEEPFTYPSGLKSPVYVDCRKLIAYPRLRATLMQLAVGSLARDVGLERFDAVAGGETAGIPFAAWISDRLALPMQYVRKKPKGFGRNAQIEGEVVEGAPLARERRPGVRDRDLARGPANLCRTLGIGLDLGGSDLATGPVRLELTAPLSRDRISTGPRVGLRGAPDRPWRFWLTGEPSVSAYRPAARRP